jgi:hypothetical protein
MSVKVFTAAEANRTLPLVSRIVRDIVAAHPLWRELVSQYEVAALGARPDQGESDDQKRLRAAIDEAARRIDGFVRELDEVGCHLKSYEDGTVDFYARHQDRLVFLCWRPGEPAVSYWHEVDAGFAGRRVVTPAFDADPGEGP